MRFARTPLIRALSLASLSIALGTVTLPVQASSTAHVHAPGHGSVKSDQAAARQQATEHTQALIALQKRWAKAQGSEKSKALEQMIAKAEERRGVLRELLKTNPAEVLNVSIPEEKQVGMPAEVASKLEQHFALSGELEVFYEDRADGSHTLRHFLKTAFAERFELHFAGKAPQLAHGSSVNVDAMLLESDDQPSLDGDLVLSEADTEILQLAAGGDSTGGSNGGTALASSATFGAQSTLVINVNFPDNTTQPWTPEQARERVFTTASNFIRENSFGQTWLSGDVTGWLRLPISSSGCDTTSILSAARDAATSAGYNVSQYNRLIVAMPSNSSCGFSGVGSVGGATSTMLINGSMQWYTVAHEMGHNLGLYHSHALECGANIIGSNCSNDEYGDGVDIMGRVSGHFNAFQKERLGWLNSSNMLTVSGSGIQELESYAATQGSLPKALKISKGTDSASGQPAWYYVEYRGATGFDSVLSNNVNVQNGVVIHSGVSNRGNTSYMLDMTPGSTGSNYTDTRDPALEVGRSFTDSDANVTLATEWVDGNTARVNVQVAGTPTATCTRANPSLSLTPGQSAWVPAGTPVSYTLTLTSRDSSACSSSSYALNASVPSGWSRTFGSSALTLAPGETRSTTLTVTSSSSAADGFYAVGTTATSSSYSASATVTQVIDNPVVSNSAPKALSDSANTAYETPVTISVLSNDSDPDGDTLRVSSVSGGTGSAVINSNGTITFTPANGFSGTTSFSYSITDGRGGSASATVTVNVAAPSVTNQAPVAVNDYTSTAYETPVTINVLGNDSDPDGDTLRVTSVTGGNGNAVINGSGTITFTPANGFSGTTSFIYTITDGRGASTSAIASVNVGAAPVATNQAPIAINDNVTMSTISTITIPVLNNDYDPEGKSLRIVAVTQGSKGDVRINTNGTLTYTPGKPFKSDDSFGYTISDGEKSASATVNIQLLDGNSNGNGNGKGKNR